jgi:hypothetical protein
MNFPKMHGIKRQYIIADRPQQNGVAKKKEYNINWGCF